MSGLCRRTKKTCSGGEGWVRLPDCNPGVGAGSRRRSAWKEQDKRHQIQIGNARRLFSLHLPILSRPSLSSESQRAVEGSWCTQGRKRGTRSRGHTLSMLSAASDRCLSACAPLAAIPPPLRNTLLRTLHSLLRTLHPAQLPLCRDFFPLPTVSNDSALSPFHKRLQLQRPRERGPPFLPFWNQMWPGRLLTF